MTTDTTKAGGAKRASQLRKPGKRERRGIQAICSEMDASAHDMLAYRNASEHKRR